jgi:hypothetical protein
MDTPTTLIEFARREVRHYENAATRAVDLLRVAQRTERAVRSLLTSRTEKLVAIRGRLEEVRQELHDIPSSADGSPLLDEFRRLTAERRRLEARVAEARNAIAKNAAKAQRAGAVLAGAQANLGQANQRFADARKDAAERASWLELLGSSPLQEVMEDSEALLASAPYAARQEFANDGHIPAPLRSSALKRRELERARLRNAHALADRAGQLERERIADDNERAVANRQSEFEAARGELHEFVESSGRLLQRARSFLEKPIPVITEAERQRLDEDAAARVEAAGKHDTLIDAQMTFETLLRERREQRLVDEVEEPEDYSDLGSGDEGGAEGEAEDEDGEGEEAGTETETETEGEVEVEVEEEAEGPVAEAKAARDAAADDFEAHRDRFTAWQAILPDDVSGFFLEYHDVREILDRLRDADPAALSLAATDAEKALVEARTDAAETTRGNDTLDVRAAEYGAIADAMGLVHSARVVEAVRGESFLPLDEADELDPTDEDDAEPEGNNGDADDDE